MQTIDDIKLYGGNIFKQSILNMLVKYIEKIESIIIEKLGRISKISHLSSDKQKKESVSGVIGYGNKMGEGWLLTAEIIDLIKTGYNNIVCVQPFGCLPNHISGKGMLRTIKNKFKNANVISVMAKIKLTLKNANVIPLDYDPGASKTNQENRLSLMLALAKENK